MRRHGHHGWIVWWWWRRSTSIVVVACLIEGRRRKRRSLFVGSVVGRSGRVRHDVFSTIDCAISKATTRTQQEGAFSLSTNVRRNKSNTKHKQESVVGMLSLVNECVCVCSGNGVRHNAAP